MAHHNYVLVKRWWIKRYVCLYCGSFVKTPGDDGPCPYKPHERKRCEDTKNLHCTCPCTSCRALMRSSNDD